MEAQKPVAQSRAEISSQLSARFDRKKPAIPMPKPITSRLADHYVIEENGLLAMGARVQHRLDESPASRPRRSSAPIDRLPVSMRGRHRVTGMLSQISDSQSGGTSNRMIRRNLPQAKLPLLTANGDG